MAKSHKKYKKHKTYNRKSNKNRKSHKTNKICKHSKGGVGITGQAAALTQAFQGLTNKDEHYDVISEVLRHQSVEDRDEVERQQRRIMARANLDERLIELEAENIERERVIRDLLATINGTIEPDLVQRISRLGRPSHPLQRELIQRGQDIREAIQEEIENLMSEEESEEELTDLQKAVIAAKPDGAPMSAQGDRLPRWLESDPATLAKLQKNYIGLLENTMIIFGSFFGSFWTIIVPFQLRKQL